MYSLAALPSMTRAGAGEEAQVVDDDRDLIDRGADRLAGVLRLEAAELVGPRLDGVGELEQQPAALAGGRVLPGLEGGRGGVRGAIDVLGAGRLDLGDDLAVGGVLDIERLARRRIDPFAPDELLIRLDALEDVGHVRNPPEDSVVAGDCPAIVLRRKEPSRRVGRTAYPGQNGLAGPRHALDQVGGADGPLRRLDPLRHRDQPASQRAVRQQLVDRVGQLLVAEVVGRQAAAEPCLVDALGVVDLVPEERQDDHRLAVVERLGDGVVAAVGDDQVDPGQDRRLGQEPLARLVVVQGDLVGQRTLGDDDPVLGRRQQVDQPLHQGHVRRTETAQREVDQRAIPVRRCSGRLPGRVRRPDRRIQPVPGRARAGARARSQPRPGSCRG